MGIGKFLGGLNQGLQQLTPQQRAMLLRTAAATTRSPMAAKGFTDQAQQMDRYEMQRRENAVDDERLRKRMAFEREKFDESLRQYKEQQMAEAEANRKAMLDQENYRTGITEYLKIQSSGLPDEEKQNLVATLLASNNSTKFHEFIASVAKKGPLVQVNTGDMKAPNGYLWNDPGNPQAGVSPIPGGPATTVTPEQAAKTQSMEVALAQLPRVKELVYTKDGKVDRTNIFNAEFQTPWSEGRDLWTAQEYGIQAITRGETGAAMPPEELENTRKRFAPKPLDSDELIAAKLRMYEEFVTGALDLYKRGRQGGKLPMLDLDKVDQVLKEYEKDANTVDWDKL